jgi:Flp pilus assembly CpaF family ATPase
MLKREDNIENESLTKLGLRMRPEFVWLGEVQWWAL